jgi:hypothetical protein
VTALDSLSRVPSFCTAAAVRVRLSLALALCSPPLPSCVPPSDACITHRAAVAVAAAAAVAAAVSATCQTSDVFSVPSKPLAFFVGEGRACDDAECASYVAAAAAPSPYPARRLCSVCGFEAPYTCRRCGSRFCGVPCQQTHKETRCMKF